MKILTLALFAALTAAALAADTPDQIAADYREKAAAAVKKVNETLETATVPLIADLVKQGNIKEADLLRNQLKDKMAGEPVPAPQATAASLFKSYDTARKNALVPAQKSAISRIDTLLASSDGKKLSVVEALGNVRAEIEAGKVSAPQPVSKTGPVPERWTYHMQLKDTNSLANIDLKPNGDFIMSHMEPGKWERSTISGIITVKFAGKEDWKITLNGDDTARIDRPDVGRRYMKVRVAK